MRQILIILTLLDKLSLFVTIRPCEVPCTTSELSDRINNKESASHTTAYCRSLSLTQVPRYLCDDVINLDLGENKLSLIGLDDFVNVAYLRVLILSDNYIESLECRCFSHLRYLERLDLRNNKIASFTQDTFVGLGTLGVLLLNNLPLSSYPTEFVIHTPELRVLSLSAIDDIIIPAEYSRLPRLETLDLNESTDRFTNIRPAMFDKIRKSNITTLSIRNMNHLLAIDAGVFSNMPNLRSLIFSCNMKMSFMATVVVLAPTRDTTVKNVILDGAMAELSVMNISAFCSPFWRQVRRLSVRYNRIIMLSGQFPGCFQQIREFVADYNTPNYAGVFVPRKYFPNIQLLSVSHKSTRRELYESAYCHPRHDRFDVNDYFPIRPRQLSMRQEDTTNHPCGEDYVKILPYSLEYIYMTDARTTPEWTMTGTYCSGNIRYVNMSGNTFFKTLCNGCRVVGDNRLEVVDLSHGVLENITENLFKFPKLRFLNLSHNHLGKSRLDFQHTFIHLFQLEDINLSHNELRIISPMAFQRCARLKRLILASNKLTLFDMNISHMTTLEYIDLSENNLACLSEGFTTKLDQQFNVHPLELNVLGDMFICTCKSVSFVLWIRDTSVRLTDVDKMTCFYDGRREVSLTRMKRDKIEAMCDVRDKPVEVALVLITVGVLIFVSMLCLARYHRWYITYHAVLCCEQGRGATTGQNDHGYNAMVLYFIHSTNPRDQQDGVAIVSRWVCTQLLPRARDEWGLLLYIGDRDDIVGVSKMYNFVRGFHNSDKVVVCLTRGFIDDSDSMNYLATALDSSKPLSKYIFVLFDDIQPTSVPPRLRQLLNPDSPSVQLRWDCMEGGDMCMHNTFWLNMRDALMHDPDQERCRRRFDVIPLLVSFHSQNISQQERD